MNKDRVDADNELLGHINQIRKDINGNGRAYKEHQFRQELSAMYSNSAAYSNVIMLGGYAATFAIWNMLSSDMTAQDNLIVGILLMLSVFFFAAFEVYKMISDVRKARRMRKILDSKMPSLELANVWSLAKDFYKVEESRVWTVQIWITVPTGFGAGAYLLCVMVTNLVNAL